MLLVNKRLLLKFIMKLGLTEKLATDDTWTSIMNFEGPDYQFVRFIDKQNELIIEGWIRTFSKREGYRELVLEKVNIWNLDGEQNDTVETYYIS